MPPLSVLSAGVFGILYQNRRFPYDSVNAQAGLAPYLSRTVCSDRCKITAIATRHSFSSAWRSPASRAQQRIDLVGRLKEAIGKRKSWEQVEKLLGELEDLL